MSTTHKTRRRALFAAALIAITGGLAIASSPAQAETTLPLGNPGTTGGVFSSGSGECSGLNAALNYWHFVVVPNSGAGSFISITLSLNNGSGPTSFTFSGAQIIPNGSQTDNVFVQVPAGYEIDDIVGGTAVISGTGDKFNLSHSCTAALKPLTASKTAAGTYDTNFHWTLDKSVDVDSHTGTAGTNAGDSTWTVKATKVIDPNNDFKVSGTITINNANTVAVPVTVTDKLNDGTVATVNCPAASVPASGSLVCTYSAVPAGASATLNTATITPGLAGVGGTTANAAVAFTVENANGDTPVALTDEHQPSIDKVLTDGETRTAVESFPCSADASVYTDGAYSYKVVNTAKLDGGSTHLTDSAEVVVNCTLQPVVPTKTAKGEYTRTVNWDLTKVVDVPAHVGTAGDLFTSTWHIEATKHESNSDFKVTGTVKVANPAAIAQSFSVSDVLNDGTVADVTCPGTGDETGTVPAGGSVTCDYTASPADASATLNTATVTVAGNAPQVATAPVAFSETLVVGDDSVDLTDTHLGITKTITSSTPITEPENFECSSNPADYLNGSLSYKVTNVVKLIGSSTDLEATAEVKVDCSLPALTVEKTADGRFDRKVSWSLDKSVDIPSFTGVPGQSFLDQWNIDVTRSVTDQNFAVKGTVTIKNPAAIPQSFTAVDALNTGDGVTLVCPSAVVPAGGSVVCTYDRPVANGSATKNTVKVLAPGNGVVEASAPVAFAFSGTFIGDVTTDLTDARLPVLDHPLLAAAILLHAPETFTCPAASSSLYVNGVYTNTFVNVAKLDGVTTHLVDDASVTITCKQARVAGGHTIGYYFNAPAGNALTLAQRSQLAASYPNVLAGVDLSTSAKIKAFGNNANCSGTCTTMLQAQFIATAMQVRNSPASYGAQCVAVPTYISAGGTSTISNLLVRINVLFPTLTTAQRIQLSALLDSINNDQAFLVC